jgi:hypothetical protein
VCRPPRILLLAIVTEIILIACAAVHAEDSPSLRVLQDAYPRAFFFRSSEGFAANGRVPYERWDACFSRLMGIEGKVLEEEIPGRSVRNIDFFTRFKKEHPEQLVLLHYNGNARDPRFQLDEFFAGHFLYFNGARIVEDVPAEEGQTEIKFTMAGDTPGSRKNPEVPFHVHRLVFAVGTFTDSAICYSFTPPKPRGELIGIWDELRKGTENELGWLGRPLGPAVRLAETTRDLLDGRGEPIGPEMSEPFDGKETSFSCERGGLRVRAIGAEADSLRFRLRGVPCDGPDLFVSVTARGEPREGYPTEMARMAWVGIAPPEAQLVGPEGRDALTEPVRYMTWLNDREFTSGFYFSDVRSKTVDLEWTVEGREPISIQSIHVHAHPDVIYREFEHGVVLANPSPRPYELELDRLFPGRKLRRLRGSPGQDPANNDGSTVGAKLTVRPKEGLFLVKED